MNPPIKKKNSELRKREYLTQQEIEKIRKAAKQSSKHGHRNDTLILMMFRHALRVGEAVNLSWDQVDLNRAELHVTRLKNGKPSTHPLDSTTLRALGRLRKNYPQTPYLFVTDQHLPLSVRTAHHIIAQAGKEAGLPFTIHPHMLRHSTGFYLANRGVDTRAIQAYMGHSDINTTVIYTAMDANRFNSFWR